MRRSIGVAILCLFAAMVLLSARLYNDQARQISYGSISVEQSKKIVESTPSIVVVDVRYADEFKTGHLEGALNLCVCDEQGLVSRLSRESEILVYCLSGTRSLKAMMILNEHGFRKVYNMLGGIAKWKEQGYSIVT